MINAEKYKDEIMNNCKCEFGFSNRIVKCEFEECPSCLFSNMNNDDSLLCTVRKVRWLLSEYKEPIKLSRLEHDILKHLLEKTQYRFIVRERNGIIYIYKSNPKKEAYSWRSLSLKHELCLFNSLFQFVNWEDTEPRSIEELLKNCEVADK